MLLYFVSFGQAASSDWLKSPQPKFPQTALKNYLEGSVRLRVLLAEDGSVRDTRVIKSSGIPILDRAAQEAVLQWKMKPTAIKSADVSKGRDEIIEFKQEAPVAAVYPDRVAYVGTTQHNVVPTFSKLWMFAPFPSYPVEARQYHEQGTAFVGLIIGKNGDTENIQLVRSSGFRVLDQAALRAVALWRAHKQYAGLKFGVPISFTLFRPGH
jgi:TonB family protein